MRARRHLIRFEGARHDQIRFCSPLLRELPHAQPREREGDVTFPKSIPRWRIPDRLLRRARRRVPSSPARKGASVKSPGGRIPSIERLLRTPGSDGRHRAVNLILAPYLTTVRGMDEERAIAVVRRWVAACRACAGISVTDDYIRYQVRYPNRKAASPVRYESLLQWSADAHAIGRLERTAA